MMRPLAELAIFTALVGIVAGGCQLVGALVGAF
jgi:hypothetical protein